jgi:hypothetical protein
VPPTQAIAIKDGRSVALENNACPQIQVTMLVLLMPAEGLERKALSQ